MTYDPITKPFPRTPWVRVTFLFHDDDVVRLGVGTMIFFCIKCGAFKPETYKDLSDMQKDVLGSHGHPIIRAARDRFQLEHLHQPSDTPNN